MTHLATAKALVMRDGRGRAPAAGDDIARKAEIDAVPGACAENLAEAAEAIGEQIQTPQAARKGCALYEGGRDPLSVLGVETVPEATAVLRAKCNGEGTPNFDGLLVGDYIDIPSLAADGATYANRRIPLSGFNRYRNMCECEACRNTKNSLLFTFDKIVLKRRMNPTNANAGGYPSSELRTFLEGAGGDGSGLFAVGLREAIGDYLHAIKKRASVKGAMARGNCAAFLPAAPESGAPFLIRQSDWGWRPGDEEDTVSPQRRFPIFSIRQFQKKHGANYDRHWLSTPLSTQAFDAAASAFCYIHNHGLAASDHAASAGGAVGEKAMCDIDREILILHNSMSYAKGSYR
jgi:hypothetical protein